MYAVFRQAHHPTAVEFSVYCNFISSEEKNLVVAGTSQLYVYRIIHDYEVYWHFLSVIFITHSPSSSIPTNTFFTHHYPYYYLHHSPSCSSLTNTIFLNIIIITHTHHYPHHHHHSPEWSPLILTIIFIIYAHYYFCHHPHHCPSYHHIIVLLVIITYHHHLYILLSPLSCSFTCTITESECI